MTEQRTVSQYLDDLIGEIVSRTGNPEGVIFSSFESTEHVMRTMLEAGVKFRVLLGRYNSEYETSFAIAPEYLRWLFESRLVDGQESILLVSNNKAFLVYNVLNNDNTVRIDTLGNVVELSSEEAAVVPAWTFDPEDGLYWGTRAA